VVFFLWEWENDGIIKWLAGNTTIIESENKDLTSI
jgi:hypothetical protein